MKKAIIYKKKIIIQILNMSIASIMKQNHIIFILMKKIKIMRNALTHVFNVIKKEILSKIIVYHVMV